jgi:DNA-binding HxlR family transcriptional regulator
MMAPLFGIEGSGGEPEVRTGAGILTMLAAPTNILILREIASSGPKSPSEIAGESGDERLFDLTETGRAQIFVIALLEHWLARAPGGAIDFSMNEWERTIEALVEGWSTTIVHNLAAGPRTLAELEGAIEGLNLPILERHLEAMCKRDLLEARGGRRKERVYAVTDWLREGLAPLVAASRCEHRYTPEESPPIAPLDVEAFFQLALPLVRLPRDLTGSCELDVLLPYEGRVEPTGTTVRVEAGRVVSCTSGLEGDSDAWACADLRSWFGAVAGKTRTVGTGGDKSLAEGLVDGLYEALSGHPA